MTDHANSRAEVELVDPDVERCVLGSLIASSDCWDAVSDRLSVELFTGATRRAVFETVATLYRDVAPVEFLTVNAALRARAGELSGAEVELMECCRLETIVTAVLEHHVTVLRELWTRREARKVVRSFLDIDPFSGPVTAPIAEDAIEDLQRRLSAIEAGRGARIITAGELMDEMLQELERESKAKPGTELVSTGYASIDALTGGFEPGILHVYAARPGVGKSSLALGFAAALGAAGVPTAVFWWEDSARKFALRLAAYVGEIPTAMLRHGRNMRAPWWDRLMAATETVSRWPLFVESTKGLTGAQAAQRMRRLRREKGVRVVIADHFGEMKLDRREHGDRTDLALGESVKQLRDEADRLGICPVGLHQLARGAESESEPRLGWLSNSDVVGQAGRVVGFISRDKSARTVKVHFVKATYAEAGATVELGWDPNTMRIFEPPQQQLAVG